VSVEGDVKQAPLDTEPVSATMAFLEQIVQESDDSSRANETAKSNSETVL
jgi:predicted hotdog family 3-hydroxylacyl-ACP dehydratase